MPLPMCSAGCGTGSPSSSRRGLHGGSRPAKTPTRPSRPDGRTPAKSERGDGDDSDLHGDGRTGARRLVGAGGTRRGRGLPGATLRSGRGRDARGGRPPGRSARVRGRGGCPGDSARGLCRARRAGPPRRVRPGSLGVVGRVLSGCGWSRGLWVVQICCKGRCGVRVVEVKPHGSAVLLAVRGVRGRLCNRFGHRARVRRPIRIRCRLAGRALSRGSPVAGPRARGSIPGLARRAGLHKQGSAPAVHRTRLACSYFDHDGVPTGLGVDGEDQGAREFGVGRLEPGW